MLSKTLSAILLATTCYVYAQTTTLNRKLIHVVGSSEMTIVPDEIYFEIILEEYMENKNKVTMTTMETQLKSAVTTTGIDLKNLTFEQVYGKNWVRKKNKQDEYIETKTYSLKLSDPSKIDLVLDKLDAKSIRSVEVADYSHSKIEEFRKQLKIEAIKNAKMKATYLLDAVGEHLGGLVEVTEMENRFTTIGGFYMDESEISNNEYRQFTSATLGDKGETYYDGIGFKEMKLRFEIAADFEIK